MEELTWMEHPAGRLGECGVDDELMPSSDLELQSSPWQRTGTFASSSNLSWRLLSM
ncbi:hypothetical protein EJB05_26490, partial [Eragrostis curvula]